MTTPGAIGDIRGKTVLVTGASSGIGLSACEELAKRGARVIMVGRNPEKTEAAAAQVRAAAPDATVEVELCDLAKLEDMRALGRRLRGRLDHLDVLLNNAGAMHTSRKTTADGFEMTYGVNHLGYFLPTLALLPLLQAAPAARIVNVASDAHRAGKLDLDDLQMDKRGYSGWPAYGTSKLMNILFTRELARRLEGTAITANSLHPGVVKTGFARNDDSWLNKLWGLMSVFLISPESGAETSVYLCADPDVDGVTGKYFAKCREKTPKATALRDDDARRLWQISAEHIGVSAEGLPVPA
jgi:NAD(P)-dependent dehydrogenase (short-subunit alcohol dehydrogenase family)